MDNIKTNIENVTFKKGCDEWLAFKQNSVKESSYLNYKFKIDKHLKPDLGDKTLLELANYDMNEYVIKKKQEMRDGRIKDIVIVLKSILRYLKKKYKIDYDLEFNSGPNYYMKEIEVFNDNERQKLTKFLLESERIKDLGVLISLYSGLRIGEICGLKWEDIDFENKVLLVRRTVQRVYLGKNNTKIIVTVPKTRKSLRKIPLARVLIEKLKPISKDYSLNTFILTGKENKCMEPLVYRYTYRGILKECKIKYKKFHCLRHTFATRCIRVGMDIKSLSEVLGHANIGITLSTYVHSSFEVKKKYIDKL